MIKMPFEKVDNFVPMKATAPFEKCRELGDLSRNDRLQQLGLDYCPKRAEECVAKQARGFRFPRPVATATTVRPQMNERRAAPGLLTILRQLRFLNDCPRTQFTLGDFSSHSDGGLPSKIVLNCPRVIIGRWI